MRGRARSQACLALGLVLVALITPCWPLALTTFGKSSTQNGQNNQNTEKQTVGHARECLSESECSGIKGASCLESIFTDQKLRCLCGDYHEPANGNCDTKNKRARVLCNSNDECIMGAQCVVGNDTTILGRRCWCTQGYSTDEDMLCSGSPAVVGISALSLIASVLFVGYL